jgi:hypothetical protein
VDFRLNGAVGFCLAGLFCLGICGAAAYILYRPSNPMVVSAIFVGGLATSGWLFTNYRTRQNQIEKNTYDLILLYTKDKFYVDHRATVWRHFAPYAEMTDEQAQNLVKSYYDQSAYKDKEGENAGFSLVQIINFYEYLSIGIRRGVLSEDLCKAHFKTTLNNFHNKKASKFVLAIIERDNNSRSDSSKSTIFSQYRWLIQRWA